jgi:hypothetical protein
MGNEGLSCPHPPRRLDAQHPPSRAATGLSAMQSLRAIASKGTFLQPPPSVHLLAATAAAAASTRVRVAPTGLPPARMPHPQPAPVQAALEAERPRLELARPSPEYPGLARAGEMHVGIGLRGGSRARVKVRGAAREGPCLTMFRLSQRWSPAAGLIEVLRAQAYRLTGLQTSQPHHHSEAKRTPLRFKGTPLPGESARRRSTPRPAPQPTARAAPWAQERGREQE